MSNNLTNLDHLKAASIKAKSLAAQVAEATAAAIEELESNTVSIPGGGEIELAEKFGPGPHVITIDDEPGTPDEGSGGTVTAGVSSFNGRDGAVTPQEGDYTAEQITYGDINVQTAFSNVQALITGITNQIGTINSALGEMTPSSGGKRVCRFTIGTSTAGWTSNDCDYLCDGTADESEIEAAINALPSGGGEVVLLEGTYNLSEDIWVENGSKNISITGNGNATVVNSSALKTFTISGTVGSFGSVSLSNISFKKVSVSVSNSAAKMDGCYFHNCCVSISEGYADTNKIESVVTKCKFLMDEYVNNYLLSVLTVSKTYTFSVSENTFQTRFPTYDITALKFMAGGAVTGNIFTNIYKAIDTTGTANPSTISGNFISGCNMAIIVGVGSVAVGNAVNDGTIVAEGTSKGYPVISSNRINNGGITLWDGANVTGNVICTSSTSSAAIIAGRSAPNSETKSSPIISGNMISAPKGIELRAFSGNVSGYKKRNAVISGNTILDSTTAILINSGWENCLIANNMHEGTLSDNGTSNTKQNNVAVNSAS